MFDVPERIPKCENKQHRHLVFKSGRASTGTPISLNWLQFSFLFQTRAHEIVPDKMNAKLFAPWSAKSDSLARTKDCVETSSLIVFDLDKTDTSDINEVSAWCHPFTHVVHTTFSHGENQLGGFRVYIPIETPVLPSDYRALHTAVLSQLPQIQKRVDPSSGDPSRCYFMPSCPPHRATLAKTVITLSGQHIDPDQLLRRVPITAKPETIRTATTGDRYQLFSEAAVEGRRNSTLASIAGKAYAQGLAPNQIKEAALEWAHRCSPPMDEEEVTSVIDSMWNTHKRNNPNNPREVPLLNGTSNYLISPEDLMRMPPMDWTIRNLVPSSGLFCIYGQSGSGKTFLALDLACAIAMHSRWFGEPVKNSPVVYAALEGEAGIAQRLRAWEIHSEKAAPKNLNFIIKNFGLMSTSDCLELADEIRTKMGPNAVLFIDTLNRASPTADENTSADMGLVIQNSKLLADTINGLVVLVHHSGKDQSKKMRGHSSLYAAMDGVLEVTKDRFGQRAWSIVKSKDAADGISREFDLLTFKIGSDSWGMDTTSCAIRATSPCSRGNKQPVVGKNRQAAYERLIAMLEKPENITRGVDRKTAEREVAAILTTDPRRAPERAKAAVSALVDTGHFKEENGSLLRF